MQSAGLLASSNFLGYFLGALGGAFIARPGARRIGLIAAIVLSVLTTLAMGLTQNELAWHGLRFLSGVVSAVALVFMTGFVMEIFADTGRASWIGWVYGGVGMGIVLSSIVIEVLQRQDVAWDWQWIAGGLLAGLLALPTMAISAGK